jgi:hypothetical protein
MRDAVAEKLVMSPSSQYFPNNPSRHIRQPVVAAAMPIREPFVIAAHQVQDRWQRAKSRPIRRDSRSQRANGSCPTSDPTELRETNNAPQLIVH